MYFLIILLLFIPTSLWAQTPPTGFTTVTGTGWTQASNVATAPVAFSYITYTTASFGPDQQAACVISALPAEGGTLHILFRYENNANRIRLILTRVAGSNNDTLTLGEIVDNVTTTFADGGPKNLGVDIQVGDKVGIDVVSNAIEGNYWSIDVGWAEWRTVVTGTATRTPAVSYIGLGGTSPVACTQFLGQGDVATPDTTPPATDPPTWTATPAVATSQTEINLSATACTDAVGVIFYNFEACDGAACSDWGTPAIAASASPTLTVSGLTANTLYRFRFRCSDTAGNFSTTYSSIEEATTFAAADTTNPTAPTNLMVSRVAGSTSNIQDDVLISWTASTDTGGSGVNFYRVEQGDAACNNFVEIAQTSSTTITLTSFEAGIALQGTKCYKVRAEDIAQNNSDYSSNAILYPVSGGHMR